MYELKLLKTVQSEDLSARLIFLVTIHNFPMNLLCDVKQATFLFSYFLYIKYKRAWENIYPLWEQFWNPWLLVSKLTQIEQKNWGMILYQDSTELYKSWLNLWASFTPYAGVRPALTSTLILSDTGWAAWALKEHHIGSIGRSR